ncbi:acyl carrier protein [Larkinella soli]|uniref:acyl carrier protein n=1 Tax=Larkinella soli TaxID=1770527 RepID=UPI000FFC5517|nr:acyl carrier protein [Larkinella soli]
METQTQIATLLAELTGVSASAITPEAHLVRDLGLDSLDTVDLIMQLEQTFGISIPDQDYPRLMTVRAIGEYLHEWQAV